MMRSALPTGQIGSLLRAPQAAQAPKPIEASDVRLSVEGAPFKAFRVIRGAHPYATFKEALDSLLASPK